MIFAGLYNRAMLWAEHPKRERYLVGVSIFESFIFPLPTALLMIPMVIATPDKAIRLATITTVMSVFGAAIGYLLGWGAMSIIEPWITQMGWLPKLESARADFVTYGVLAVGIGAFTPAPFKIFTITAGMLSMSFIPFLLVSLVGRAAHFYMIALLMAWAGPKMEPVVRKYIEWLGWAIIVIAVVGFIIHKYM
ncbi:MAG: VTT domain-containing protein [Gammaproteobacteria bacterium]|nr:VTT domain-containing protein [Gammaproteobacteria bacterium]